MELWRMHRSVKLVPRQQGPRAWRLKFGRTELDTVAQRTKDKVHQCSLESPLPSFDSTANSNGLAGG